METAFPCIAFGNQNGSRESLLNYWCLCCVAQYCCTMDDADLPDEVPEVEVYDGPQQGLTIRNHICNTFFG